RIKVNTIVGIVSAAAALILAILLSLHAVDEVAFTDLMKVLALGGGGFLGFVFENKRVNFSTDGSWPKKIIRYLIGLGGVIAIMAAKALFPASLYAASSFVRYALIGLWATGLYPLIGTSLRLFSGDR
ncbi:MAG: phosphoesterase PA-phosphatase, partial [Sphaerochaeta sp.]|nr:phosphoesterase PA-phosphatase [Sphaerochaeta sp.]